MTSAIAIVGMACQYPDARSPVELWENILAERRAFRRIPPERLRLEDYWSADRNAPDCIYTSEAALIKGYEFDRVRFRVAGNTFRAADLTHWLALDVAAQAVIDAKFPEGEGLPHDTTGAFVGNTLTGEFCRANTLRLRWPYVHRVVDAALIDQGWAPEQRRTFLESLEAQYKAPFPPISEETLAGSLSNTIAGRICNHFNFRGGGYTVDGACAASLLAVIHACSALAAGDLDVALAGGVDLSLDPFELVGFAKVGALATEEMRVYDARSAGFWPGEGCGFVVLMRQADAVAERRRMYAIIRGWGISSDGRGGITRPEVEGQLLALGRAYRRAGFGIETVSYFEGHGTGTSVGDATELQALSRARREAAAVAPPAVIGSLKANIGHTKAAAGVAGLIKATMALQTQTLPPTTGCQEPHPELAGETPRLRVLREGQLWPTDRPLRAGVSAMGFGGINTHVVLEGIATERRTTFHPSEKLLLSSAQDAEIFLLEETNSHTLRQQVAHLLTLAGRLSRAELTDLAAELARPLDRCKNPAAVAPVRAAIVASSPAELASRLEMLEAWLMKGAVTRLDSRAGVFLGTGVVPPRIGFLFPGQGSPAHLSGGVLARRFKFVKDLYGLTGFAASTDGVATAVAQPAIVTASVAALLTLKQLAIAACVAVGHSLGELTALHWAGAFDEQALLRIATARGKAMAALDTPPGAMASIAAGRDEVESLLEGEPVVIAGLNAPRQTVISGEKTAVGAAVARAQARGLKAVGLPVSHAFHSPLVAAAAQPLAEHLAGEDFRSLQRTILSTVTGAPLTPEEDLRALLYRQVTSPVRFLEAVRTATSGVDLWMEVGPGQVLSGLVSKFVDTPVVALEAGGPSLKGFLHAVGAAFALGAPVNHGALFVDRFTRPFDLDWRPRFFLNPCELAPVPETVPPHEDATAPEPERATPFVNPPSSPVTSSPLDLVRQLVAERAELPPSAVKDDNRLLSDLHLNSIVVGQLAAEAARRLGLPPPVAPTDYADATVADVAEALAELARTHNPTSVEERLPPGVDSWIRTFIIELVERPLPRRKSLTSPGVWRVVAPQGYPLADLLRQALDRLENGNGIIVCLPPEPNEHHVGLLLEGAQAVSAENRPDRFVLVQHGGGAASFARTLHLEVPGLTTCVVDVPPDPKAVEWILAEVEAAVGHTEAYYDAAGRRREPRLRLLPTENDRATLPLGPSDVLLVTGGGKGITAECVLSLARETGVRLALLGLSQPATDAELAANLERMTAAGLNFKYIAADVTDPVAVQTAISDAVATFGPITGILHGAAVNQPQLLRTLDQSTFRQTIAIKVQGARNLLAAVDPTRLRLFVTFGSIIARTGLRGEAHYALANEWLTRLTEQFQKQYPTCQCLAVEWSAWSGVGMAQRLGGVDALVRAGITPITPDQGVSILGRLLAQQRPAVPVVVTGRLGELPTLKVEQANLPLLRFLERPRVYYPGVELVAEAELSTDTDPYLKDHVFQGAQLFPAVLGLEAMAQAAMALAGSSERPVLEQVKFNRPIVVPNHAPVTIRVAALVREPGRVEVALRSGETAFQVDHFRARCWFGSGLEGEYGSGVPEESPTLSINPRSDLYGEILFHGGRFQRLRGYRRLKATECVAEIVPNGTAGWFGRYLPTDLVLGDPAARDAAMHAVQACIPHATLLPIGVDRWVPGSAQASSLWFVHAHERSRDGDTFIYDLEVTGMDGGMQERWEGLRLRMVQRAALRGGWVEPLLGPYIERRVQELIPGSAIAVVVEGNGRAERRMRSDQAIEQMLPEAVMVRRRYDGKPEVVGDHSVSTAHADDLTLAIAGRGPLGCDIEPVVMRPTSVWRDLLGPDRFTLATVLAQNVGEDERVAATRVWAATECLKKAGAMVDAPLVLATSTADGWVVLSSGPLMAATLVTQVRGTQDQIVFAVVVRSKDAGL